MKNKKILFISLSIIFFILLILLVFCNKRLWDKGSWQAVFLSNNQVYFGKINKITNDSLILQKIYYLQAGDSLSGSDENTSKLSLVKLGSEVHGPRDQMIINRSSVLFWEDLKDDSKIVNIINNYNK